MSCQFLCHPISCIPCIAEAPSWHSLAPQKSALQLSAASTPCIQAAYYLAQQDGLHLAFWAPDMQMCLCRAMSTQKIKITCCQMLEGLCSCGPCRCVPKGSSYDIVNDLSLGALLVCHHAFFFQ